MNKRLKSPLNVQIEVTGECTSECVHCYNFWRGQDGGEPRSSRARALSASDAKKILETLRDADVFSVLFTGGEPLLNFAVTVESIRLARSMGITVGLNSNLVLLTEDKARGLKEAGLTHALTSILGPTAEIHDSITQRKGSFRALLRGIDQAREVGIRVGTNMVVSQRNHQHVLATANVVAGLGIKSFSATQAGCPGNCSDFSHLALSHSQLVGALNDLCTAHETLGLHVDTLEPIPICGLHGVRRPELFASRKCHAGVTTATISYDGTVRPCSHLDMACGNVLREDLATIWRRMAPWSQQDQIPGECRGCRLVSKCGAGCRMAAMTSTGRIDGLDPFTSVEHVGVMAEALARSNPLINAVPVERFRTRMLKLRDEEFGGVCSSGDRHAILDRSGFVAVSQLKPETEYDLSTLSIDWRGLDPQKFISGLARRGVVLVR